MTWPEKGKHGLHTNLNGASPQEERVIMVSPSVSRTVMHADESALWYFGSHALGVFLSRAPLRSFV